VAQAVSATKTPEGTVQSAVVTSLDVASGLRVEVLPEAKLRAVLAISSNLSNALDLAEVLPKILESLFAIFPQADRGFILLRDPDTGQMVTKAVRHRNPQEDDAPSISRTILDQAVQTGRAILSADARFDARFDPSQSIQARQIRSIMCVPMLSQTGESLGVLQLDTEDKLSQFRQEDLDVLVSAATQAARAVELAWLHQERRDLETASQIQKSFLPGQRPQIQGLQFFDYYSSAREVGGDYYDYIRLPGNRLAVALGDVSGKGVSAALLMARLSAAVRFCLATEPTVAGAVCRLNAELTRAGSPDRFVTFVVAVLDLDTFALTLVNAGHMPPLCRRSWPAEVDDVGNQIVGIPLGVLDRPYQDTVIPVQPGDTLILYTDGITEARNPKSELYGAERLREVVHRAPEGAEAVGMAILADVQSFAAGRPQSDDMTIVCFSRNR
jgi:serine phosphatase RsbU (regulator of sigma subunit)